MAQGELPPQLREQLQQYQNLQQQVQLLGQQKAQFESKAKELSHAKDALAEAGDDTDVYKMAGAFLIKTPGKAEASKEIEDEAETLQVRLKNVERQQSRMQESLVELQSKIQNALARMQGQPGSDDDES